MRKMCLLNQNKKTYLYLSIKGVFQFLPCVGWQAYQNFPAKQILLICLHMQEIWNPLFHVKEWQQIHHMCSGI